jgi:hypothetical protein
MECIVHGDEIGGDQEFKAARTATAIVIEERPMPTLRDARERAARTAMKEQRARDAALAMREYEAEKRAALARTERLRALRLAKEAGGAPDKKAKRPTKSR